MSEYKPRAGGGFSLYDKIIQLIDDYKFHDDIEVCFIGHKLKSDYNFKKEYICIYSLPFNIPLISNSVSKVTHKLKFIGQLEGRILKENNVDLIYYPVQGLKKVNNFPFVSANWDIGHKSSFAFPEVAMNSKFEYREKWFSKEIYKALMIFVESVSGKNELIYYTKINPERIGVVPLFPGGIIDLKVSELDQVKFLIHFKLLSKKFFFYPAQFWAHKNHYNLLLAFKKILVDFPEMKLVLTGSDKGNKNYIRESADKLGIGLNVIFTGFVSNECLYSFYKNTSALVFPGLMGPTNMPLLEARMLDCPVLCSEINGHREMLEDGALYFNPLDPDSIYARMETILNETNREELLIKSKKVLQQTFFTSKNAMISLEENIKKLKEIRSCWGKNDRIF